MMTSSGDDNWLSGSLGLLTDKTKKTEKKKPKAEQETTQPTAVRFTNTVHCKISLGFFQGFKFIEDVTAY